MSDQRVKTVNLGKLADSKIAECCAQILAEFPDEYANAEVHLAHTRLVRYSRGVIIPGFWKVTGEWVGNKAAETRP